MSSLITPLIKQLAINAVDTQQPVKIVMGKVIQIIPELLIQTDIKMPLDRGFLMFTESSNALELKVNDSLVMFKIQGGQTYLVLDRVVV